MATKPTSWQPVQQLNPPHTPFRAYLPPTNAPFHFTTSRKQTGGRHIYSIGKAPKYCCLLIEALFRGEHSISGLSQLPETSISILQRREVWYVHFIGWSGLPSLVLHRSPSLSSYSNLLQRTTGASIAPPQAFGPIAPKPAPPQSSPM